jgi:phosphoglycolate phosphatase-like HAD superfamily hydrolase
MTPQRFVVLDFDGVVCDSTEECVVTAWNAWQNSRDLVRTPGEVPEPFRSTLRRHRNYVRTAGEYVLLIEAARGGRNIGTQADYENLFDEFRPAIKPYADLFFLSRDRLRADDESHWLGLHTVYTGMSNDLHRLWGSFKVFVVTGKDSSSVQRLFESFDLPIPPSRIFDKDAAHDKLSAIRLIAANLGQTLNSAVFIDDNVHHLLPAHQAGCPVLMAGWGYHTDEQIQLAKDQAIRILELESWADFVLLTVRGGL